MARRSRPLKKLESTARPKPEDTDKAVEVIVRVRKADYVPDGITVRAQISPQIFTSVIPSETLEELEEDPQVQSVSVSHPLRTIG